MRKSNQGITLVALVITIIVMLILAGVSVNLVAGSRGIMTRAANAVSTNEAATGAEQAELKIAEIQVDYYEAYYVKESINTSMRAFIEEKGASTACANTRYYMTISDGTVKVSLGKDGKTIATRNYKTTENDFAWEDDTWTYYASYGGAPTV